MKVFLKLLRESYLFAFHEIVMNKVRTMLSFLGITIGIFSIISVFTIFDSMESSIRNSINSLGNDVLFVQKWPWAMGSDYPWWKYMNRPEASMTDLKEIQRRSQTSQASTYMAGSGGTVKFREKAINNANVIMVSDEYDKVMPVDISEGRFISPVEFNSGKPVVVIGSEIVSNLLGTSEAAAIGKKIKIFGLNVEVIGVMKKEGSNIFGNSSDDQMIVPVNFARNHMDMRYVQGAIIVKAKPGVTLDEMKDELSGIMRAVRKIKPKAEDNFAINQTDIISKNFDQLFGVIAIVGWIIGGFSLLVGGFGIANIMFVSVKERTRIIGIQKSLGAKKYFILLQFLFEAIFLSLFGGILGLIIVFLLTFTVSRVFDFSLVLTSQNILLGMSVSAFIGFVSGLIPAWNASRLDPVEAMRSTF
ncbi:MAG: FtsX-like permease family protein [Bacteroidales bacterium]|nr:FtsX-like permease family protein [Bacteroidales bacterium]